MLIMITSKMAMFHANDMLDQNFIEKGRFTSAYSNGSVVEAIQEIVELVRLNLSFEDALNQLEIKLDMQTIMINYPTLSFDKRRLQQVMYNLLSNAIKF